MQQQSWIKWLTVGGFAALVIAVVGILQFDHLSKMFGDEKSEIVKTPATAQTETADDSAYQMVIKGRMSEVQACYNSLLEKGLSKSGKLVVKWTVTPEGKASDFSEELNELDSTELYDCTTTAISNWPFPKKQTFMIRYTFKMREIEKAKQERQVANATTASSNLEPRDEVQEQLGE